MTVGQDSKGEHEGDDGYELDEEQARHGGRVLRVLRYIRPVVVKEVVDENYYCTLRS